MFVCEVRQELLLIEIRKSARAAKIPKRCSSFILCHGYRPSDRKSCKVLVLDEMNSSPVCISPSFLLFMIDFLRLAAVTNF